MHWLSNSQCRDLLEIYSAMAVPNLTSSSILSLFLFICAFINKILILKVAQPKPFQTWPYVLFFLFFKNFMHSSSNSQHWKLLGHNMLKKKSFFWAPTKLDIRSLLAMAILNLNSSLIFSPFSPICWIIFNTKSCLAMVKKNPNYNLGLKLDPSFLPLSSNF